MTEVPEAKNILGVKKDLLLVKMLKEKEVRSLPKSFLFYLREQLKYEKFVKLGNRYIINSQLPPYPSPAFKQFLKVGNAVREGKTAPSSVHIAVTNACPMDCWHCSNANREDKGDLDLDVLKETLGKLQDMGNSLIGITGGEPLLRDDLEEILSAIDERSVKMLFTTGYGLTPERAQKLKDAGLFYAVVSLDHFIPEKHDKVRGFEGAFQIGVDALKLFKETGFYTVASTVPSIEMIESGEIWEFVEFAKDLGVHEIRFLAPIPTGKIVGQRELRWQKDQAMEMFEIHKRCNADREYPRVTVFGYIEAESFLGCTAGTFHMFIEADGTVTPCDMIPLNFGNIYSCGIEKSYNRMADTFRNPRYDCFVRAAVTLIGKAYEEEGKLPLSREKSLEIANRVKNWKMSDCFKELGMPYTWTEEELKGMGKKKKAQGCMSAINEGPCGGKKDDGPAPPDDPEVETGGGCFGSLSKDDMK